MLHKYKTNSKRTCQVMKKVTGKLKKQKQKQKKTEQKLNLLPYENKVDKTIIQNPQDVAKEADNFFASVGPKLTKKSPTLKNHFKIF